MVTGTQQQSAERSRAGDGEQPDPRRWRALAVCLVGGFMTLLDVSIVNVALPVDPHGPGATESEPAVGRLRLRADLRAAAGARRPARRRPRRAAPMFVVGARAVHPRHAACGLAPSGLFLVVARLAAGRWPAGCSPRRSAALIQQLFRGARAGPGLRPVRRHRRHLHRRRPAARRRADRARRRRATAGGWVFFVNLPIGLAAMPLAWRLLPARPRRGAARARPASGCCCSASASSLLLLPLVQEQQWQGTWQVAAGPRRRRRCSPSSCSGSSGTAGAARSRWSTWACSGCGRTPFGTSMITLSSPASPRSSSSSRSTCRPALGYTRAAGRPGDHPVRARLGGRRRAGRPDRAPVRPAAGGGRPAPGRRRLRRHARSPSSWCRRTARAGRPLSRCWWAVWAAAW